VSYRGRRGGDQLVGNAGHMIVEGVMMASLSRGVHWGGVCCKRPKFVRRAVWAQPRLASPCLSFESTSTL
jgi:hypothetical protein